MKLIANGINRQFPTSYLPNKTDEVDGVLAAIAYGDDTDTLLQNCLDNKSRLDIWMRYDHTVPVQPRLLNQLLLNLKNNIFCQLIPDVLHSKIIWWQGYGAYIGSSNLTNRAWWTNIETGVFFNDEELIANNMIDQLENFFEELINLNESVPLDQNIINEQIELLEIRKKAGIDKVEDAARKRRTIPIFDGVSNVSRGSPLEKKKESFKKEWLSTVSIIDNIADQINDYRPIWVEEDIPTYWQVDQFLHAYYYNEVRQSNNTYPFEEYYNRNESNPGQALTKALELWSERNSAPSHEDETFYVNAPRIKELFAKDRLLGISVEEMQEVCLYTHATKDHVIKMKTETLGRTDVTSLTREERLPLYAKWLLVQRNKKGQDIRQVLFDILYKGNAENIWERIYNAGKSEDTNIAHYGINSIAEVIGWAQPETTPPRNGRTNKALRALGFPVKVYF